MYVNESILLNDIISQFCGAFIIVREFPNALDKVYKCVGCSGLEILKTVTKNTPKSNLFKFDDFNALTRLLQDDLSDHLLESLRNNDQLLGTVIEENLYDKNAKYSKWFHDWCTTLATLLRIKVYKRFDLALERNGVFIFVHEHDDMAKLEDYLAECEDYPVSLVFCAEHDSSAINEIMEDFDIPFLVINSYDGLLDDKELFEFVSKFIYVCYENIENDVSNLHNSLKNLRISSKILKSPESDKILCTMFLLMHQEMSIGLDTLILTVCKSNLDHYIQALSNLLYGIYLYKYKPQSQVSVTEESGPSSDTFNLLSHFEKAAFLFNKFSCPWQSFFAGILSVIIGEHDELNKLLYNNSVLLPRTQNEYGRSALCIELSSNICTKPKKKKFQLVMAGRLYSQAGLQNLSKRCYLSSLDEYKHWDIAHEHLYSLLGSYDTNYLLICLNIFSNMFENRHSSLSSGDEVVSKSADSENQIYYLKNLMKKTGFDISSKHLLKTPISAPYLNHPTIYYEHHELPLIDSATPFLVRIPIVYMRSNGIIGTNIKLMTNYVDDVYEKLLDNSFKEPIWQKCLKFYNIKDHLKKNTFPLVQRDKGPNYMIDTKLNLSLQLLNPLSVPIDCFNFKVLVQKLFGTSARQIFGFGNLKWVDCSVKSTEDTESFKLLQFEKKSLVLRFDADELGSFRVVGLSWKFFNKLNLWCPVYTVGKKLKTIETSEITLVDYIKNREVDKALYFNVYKDRPQFLFFFRKVSDLSPLQKSEFYAKKEFEYTNFDSLLRFYSEKYSKFTLDMVPEVPVAENENLSLFEYLNGESGLIEISLGNKEDKPIALVILTFKILGSFNIPPYPVFYKLSQPTNLTEFDIETGLNNNSVSDADTVAEGSNIECTWNMINLPDVKVKDVSLSEKMYEVVMKFKDENTTLYNQTLSIYLFLEALLAMDGISFIDGTITIVPKYGLDLDIPFKIFLRTRSGPIFSAHYNYKDVIKFHAQNKSRKEITRLDFTVNDKALKCTNFTESSSIPPKSSMNLIVPMGVPLMTLVDPNNPVAERMKFSVFWSTLDRFGVFNGNVEMLDYKVLVKSSVGSKEYKLTSEPVVVELFLTVLNLSAQSLDSLTLYPLEDYGEESLIKFVGVTRKKIQSIQPKSAIRLDFHIIIPVPGVYNFSPLDFKLEGTPDEQVMYQDNINTIVVYN